MQPNFTNKVVKQQFSRDAIWPGTSDWRVPDTRPYQIIFSNTRSIPDIFSESSGISGIGYYRKVGFCYEATIIFKASSSKILPILKMPQNFWPVSLWNCKISDILHQHLNHLHLSATLRQSILKNSTDWKSKRSQKYLPIHGIHLDIDKVIFINLVIVAILG